MTRSNGDTCGAGPAEALVGLSPADLRDYIIRAHGMAMGNYCQSDTEMRAGSERCSTRPSIQTRSCAAFWGAADRGPIATR